MTTKKTKKAPYDYYKIIRHLQNSYPDKSFAEILPTIKNYYDKPYSLDISKDVNILHKIYKEAKQIKPSNEFLIQLIKTIKEKGFELSEIEEQVFKVANYIGLNINESSDIIKSHLLDPEPAIKSPYNHADLRQSARMGYYLQYTSDIDSLYQTFAITNPAYRAERRTYFWEEKKHAHYFKDNDIKDYYAVKESESIKTLQRDLNPGLPIFVSICFPAKTKDMLALYGDWNLTWYEHWSYVLIPINDPAITLLEANNFKSFTELEYVKFIGGTTKGKILDTKYSKEAIRLNKTFNNCLGESN